MSDALQDLETELNAATDRARQLVDGAEPRLFTVRPHMSSWSAAECIAHLNTTSELFVPILEDSIEAARKSGVTTTRAPRMDVVGALLRWFMEPPVRVKTKTAAPFVPRGVRAKAESLAEFVSVQNQILDLIHSAHDLDLRKLKIVSPFDKRIKYNVYSAFRILVAHQRRHLWQAEQAIGALRQAQMVA